MTPKPKLPLPDLSEVVDLAIGRLMSGQPADVDSLCAANPHLREQLEAVLPAVQAMAEFGEKSAEKNGQTAMQAKSERLRAPQPKNLGDFRILREIGRGGMGVVYEAEQRSLRRRVALKVLPFASVLDPRQLQRFKNEAQAAAALKHPHVVSVHSVGCERGVHFYAMDLVEGQSLAEVIRDLQADHRAPSDDMHPNADSLGQDPHVRRGTPCRDSRRDGSCHLDGSMPPPSPIMDPVQTAQGDTQPAAALSTTRSTDRRNFFRGVARLGIQAAEALQYAHECGIVHRDIKPSNLLIDRHAKLWVTDFGLAMTHTGDGLTLTGDLIGTLRYMSPEQAAGNWALVDHRTDIYSLGVTLYELLSLRPAFEGTDRQMLLRKIDEREAPLLRSIDGSIPKDLETIVMKAMAKDAHERYATAAELAEDLQRFLDLKPIRARRSTRVQKLWRWAKRNPRLATVSAIASFLTLLLAVAGPIVAVRQRELAQQLELQLYDAQMSKAHMAALRHDFEGAARILEDYIPKPGLKDHRSFEWYHLWWSCQRVLDVPTIARSRSLHCASYSTDGRYIAVGDRGGSVALYEAESRKLIWPRAEMAQGHSGQVNELVFTPDSKLLVSAGRDMSLRIWCVATGKQLQPPSCLNLDLEVTSLAISSDGETLVAGFAQPDQRSRDPIHISIWQVGRSATGVTLEPCLGGQLNGLVGRVFDIAISQDDRFLAACCRDGRIRIWDLKSGKSLPSLKGHSGMVRHVAFSPTGSDLLASASYEESVTAEGGGEIKLWDIRAGSETATLRKHAFTRSIAFSPDGRQLAAGDHDGMVRVWDVPPGDLVREFPAHGKQIIAIDFSPHEESLLTASYDKTVKVWKGTTLTQKPTRIFGHGACILRLASSHDGRLLLSAGSDGIAKLWDARTGQEIATLQPESRLEHLFAAAFSPDDKFVAVGGGYWRRWNQPLESCLWDLTTGERKVLFSDMTCKAHGTVILGVAFSPEGDRVAAGIGEEIRIWRVPDGQLLNVIHGHNGRIDDLTWAQQTNRIATLNMNPAYELRLWDGQSGEKLAALPVPEDVSHMSRLAFSPDGQTLAVGTLDGEILLFDVVKCRFLKRLTGHTAWVLDLAFSSDGLRLASASQDRTVKLWNLQTQTALLTFREPRNDVWAVCFSPDGRALFAASDHGEDSVIHVWRATTPDEAQLSLDSRLR